MTGDDVDDGDGAAEGEAALVGDGLADRIGNVDDDSDGRGDAEADGRCDAVAGAEGEGTDAGEVDGDGPGTSGPVGVGAGVAAPGIPGRMPVANPAPTATTTSNASRPPAIPVLDGPDRGGFPDARGAAAARATPAVAPRRLPHLWQKTRLVGFD